MASKFAKPDTDLHVHTYLSACCAKKDEQQPAAILGRAAAMGVYTIGFADHLWMNPAVEPSDWYRPQDMAHVARLRADVAALAQPPPVRILFGCEADTRAPGEFSITPDAAESFDFTLLSCSHFHMKGFVEQPEDESPAAIGRHLLRFFRAGARSGLATAIAHPFLPIGFTDRFEAAIASIPDSEFADVFGTAAETHVAIEVTTSFLPADDGWSLETPARFLRLAREAGCRFTFGTDAHAAASQLRLPLLQPLIAAAGITEDDVLRLPRMGSGG